MPIDDSKHSDFKRPPKDARLWRYIDLSKYVSMMSTGALWFSRADQLGDPFEGSLSQANVGVRPSAYSNLEESDLERLIQKMGQHRREALRHMFVSCWHCSEWESAAMWRLYMRDHGIAVVSTYDRMRRALRGSPSIFVGFVNYVDYKNEFIGEGNMFTPFMPKRKSFEHEREVRAIFMDYSDTPVEAADDRDEMEIGSEWPEGRGIDADLSLLIDSVRVAPDAPEWFVEMVADTTQRFGLRYPVVQSDLSGEPVY